MPLRYLVDTSALARTDRPSVQERLRPVIEEGTGATCGAIELEVFYSARGPADMADRERTLADAFAHLDMSEADFAHAKELMGALAAHGKHGSAGLADLLIAACARREGLALLHYDSDFDAIASVTGQAAEWVVPRGSVP